MKRFSLFLIAFIISYSLLGQNLLILKSGEKIKGKIDRFRNDTLTFNFKGNKMIFKSSEILSLYFDEKDFPKEETSSITQISEQEGKITGVVTYFFNDNYGDKPDIGAKVLIIEISKVNDFNFLTVDSFHYANSYRNLYNSYALNGKSKIPDNIINGVKSYGVDTKEGFDALDNRVQEELNKIRFTNIFYCKKLVVDGNGVFSANVPAGNYYVYVTSNNRKGHSMTEIMGKIICKKVIVNSKETSNLNAKFDLY